MTGGFGVVDVLAFAAVEFDGLHTRYVGHASGEEWLGVAVDTGAFSKLGFFVFLDLFWVIKILC